MQISYKKPFPVHNGEVCYLIALGGFRNSSLGQKINRFFLEIKDLKAKIEM